MSHVFISYVREDAAQVERMAHDLRQYGVEVWLDRHRIRPGERWQQSIRRAIREGPHLSPASRIPTQSATAAT